MKKRMFLSTVLMALVLLVAVTTATFAWYQAATGGVSAEEVTAAITTETDNYNLDEVEIKVDYSSSGSEFTAGEVALTDDDGYVWAYNDRDELVKATTTTAKGIVVTVTLSLEADAPQAAGEYTVTIEKSGTHASRLKLIDKTSLPSVGADNYANEPISWTLTIDEDGKISSGATYTFVVAFDGNDSGTPDTVALEAAIGVSIA